MKFNFVYVKNDVYRKNDISKAQVEVSTSALENANEEDCRSLLDMLRANAKDIDEKKFGSISSFNFNRNVFYKGRWNELSKIARGLFIDTSTGHIAARGFDKFFNYCEGQFNTDAWLKGNLKFPATAYKKYNGFLGILGFDKSTKSFLFCSKSCIEGTYPTYFKDIFYELKKDEDESYFTSLANHMIESDSCLLFEVIDPKNDPHIVKYDREDLVLLDEVKLTQKFSHSSYEELCDAGKKFGFKVKEKIGVFNDWDELKSLIDEMQIYSRNCNEEGCVIEDAVGYHFKMKLGWYKFWKEMRRYMQKIAKGQVVSTSGLQTPLMNKVFAWMKAKPREWYQGKSIIDVRDEFEKEMKNGQ